MRTIVTLGSLFLGVGLCLPAGAQTNIAPEAREILANACNYLAQTPFFGLTAEVWREHVNASGEKLQFTRVVKMEVKRPDRLHVEIESPHTSRGLWYNGQTLTILDRRDNLYSTTPMPETLDDMLDVVRDRFGIDLPLADLALSDPYSNAVSRVEGGRYLGLSQAMGYTCHHLAFTQDNIDWQVWIQDGPQPLIRKFVITHKSEAGSPEFTALIRGWDMTERIADSDFAFMAPRGATRINMREQEIPPSPTAHPETPAEPPSATGRQ